jgi:cytoskeletal protein CcmA (bactofilin family)
VKRKMETSGELSGFLDVGTDFHGEVSFKETLRIDGKFEGAIRDGRLLIVGETADVNADIDVVNISVSGRLRGNVRAKDRVELHESARCQCNLDTRVLVVEEGALFEGSCTMQGSQGAASSPREVGPVGAIDNVKRFATSD